MKDVMNPERWRKVEQLYHSALDREGSQRAAFLAEACADDDSLRREIESLLAHQSQAENLLESPVMEVAAKVCADDQADSLLGQSLGSYKILSRLGAGGMGEVYCARDTRLDRTVAIKILPVEVASVAERKQRFIREAKAASALHHPNVAHIYEISEAEGLVFIAMEHIEGQTLAARINGRPLELNEIVEIGSQIADALDEAHSKGITHRDIKPANVMLTPRGQVKVLDFGLAKITRPATRPLTSDISTMTKTEPGMVMGTVPYMSPEQALGREVDHRSDMFSLGVTLYEMVTGRLPFSGANTSETLDRILHAQPEAMARFNYAVPAELERIVRKCLEKDSERRYQSARELLVDLKNLKRESDWTIHTAVKPEGLPSDLKRNKMGLVFATLAVVISIGAIAYLASFPRQKSEPSPPMHRPLAQLTYGGGLQSEPSWSPDGRFIAYSSDRSGNLDIWLQQADGSDPVQVTKSPAHDWQPNYSPDGSSIVFRSERDGGGLYVTPALGGNERKISSFGYNPCWSPDGSRILFVDTNYQVSWTFRRAYIVALDGEPPREVQPEFLSGFPFFSLRAVAWHPDGQRISVWGERGKSGMGLWTIPLAGGAAIRSEMAAEVETQIKETGVFLWKFIWSPSGRYLYFEGLSKSSLNLWRFTINPQTLRWIAGPERLTTDASANVDIALSTDGRKLAYTIRTVSPRIWSIPFNAATSRIKGAGQPVTAAGITVGLGDLSRDGRKLSFWVNRGGKQERWIKSLDGGQEQLLAVEDDFIHEYGFWSRDGTRLVARRFHRSKTMGGGAVDQVTDFSTVIYPADGGGEEVLTTPTSSNDNGFDWSRDGQWILGFANPIIKGPSLIRLLPIAAAPHAERQARVVTFSEEYNLWQPRFSPDDRWVCFIAVKRDDARANTVYVVHTVGGEWTRITEDKYFDDKPRWAPDGKTIYFTSTRTGFNNVWGIHFDPATGKPVGEPFRVTAFENPARMIQSDELGVAANRLVVTIREVTGNIWTLENVDR